MNYFKYVLLFKYKEQHPFIRDAAIELQNNKGTPKVMKDLVERMIIRQEEMSRLKKSSESDEVRVYE